MRSFIFFVLPFVASSSSCVTSEAQEADVASLLQTSRVRGKDVPSDVPTGEDTYGRKYSSDYTNRVNKQVEQVTAVVEDDQFKIRWTPEGANQPTGVKPTGLTVVADNGEDMQTRGYLKHATYHQHRVCVGASDDAVAGIADYHVPEFDLDEPICFNKLKIGYLAGYVSCRNPDHGKSHYGCDQDSIGLVLTKKIGDAHEVIFPKAVKDGDDDSEANKQWNIDNIVGYSFMGHGHADWYKVEGYTGDENVLQLQINPDGEGGVFLPKGTYQLWYHEDFTAGTENDNSGVACYHLDFELCQGTHDSHFHELTTPAPAPAPVQQD